MGSWITRHLQGLHPFRYQRRDERGIETVATLIMIPFLFVLVMGLVDIGLMFRARMAVESIARDAARGAAADGGNYWARTNSLGDEWDDWAKSRMWSNRSGCTISRCLDNEQVSVNCRQVTPLGGGTPRNFNVAQQAGDVITCTVYYPYKGYNKGLLDSPFGLGMGSFLKPFDISVSARAETGTG